MHAGTCTRSIRRRRSGAQQPVQSRVVTCAVRRSQVQSLVQPSAAKYSQVQSLVQPSAVKYSHLCSQVQSLVQSCAVTCAAKCSHLCSHVQSLVQPSAVKYSHLCSQVQSLVLTTCQLWAGTSASAGDFLEPAGTHAWPSCMSCTSLFALNVLARAAALFPPRCCCSVPFLNSSNRRC